MRVNSLEELLGGERDRPYRRLGSSEVISLIELGALCLLRIMLSEAGLPGG